VNGVSETVSIPADAFPVGTSVSIYPVVDPTPLEALLSTTQSLVLSFAVTWQEGDGTSPPSASPLTASIEDPSIKAGDSIYEVTSTGLKLVGTATVNGTVTITFTTDPIYLIAHQNLLLQAPLKISSGPGQVGLPLGLTTNGGSGSGSVSYSVVNGSGKGCQVTGHALTALSPGTCIVTATKAGDSKYSPATSLATSIPMVVRTALGYVLVQFLTGGSSLNSKAEAALGVLARKLKVGAVIACTGYAANNPVLALRRAAVVADFLSKRVLVRVTLRSVTNGLDGWTTVTS